ncbi:MAG TPA: hypothetical protein VGG40_05745 [Solirubrobacterales bacterium]|jgi:hypothetical protein
MADENPMARRAISDLPANAKKDLEDQALVLDRLLVHWPIQLQDSDIQRELALGDNEFERRDRVDRAVVHLHWAGLALRSGAVVLPTRAALHFHLLGDDSLGDL